MTRLRIGHRARRPSTEERGAVESKPRFTRLQKASAAVATLAGAAALATHGADGPSLPSAPGPAADAKAFDALLEGYSSRQCSIYDTQPGSADLTPSDGWSGTLQIAVQAVDSGAPLSSAVIEDLCSVERSALAVPHQAEAASTTERDAAAVAVASVARIFSASVRAAPGEKTAAVDALVNATKGLSGQALVGHLTALKTAAAELEKRVRTPIAAEPGVVTAVLAAAPDPDAATTARPLSVADRKQVTAGYQRALDAARAGIEAAEARIVAEVVDGDYPRGVPAAVRAAIVTGVEAKGYDAVKAEAHLGYLKTPEALAAAMPGIVGAANEAAAEALFGADAPPEVIAAAQQEYLQGGTPESMLAAARAKVAAMPWKPSAMPVEIAPAGASQAEKLQYYLRLVNSVTDVRALPTDKPIALAIRGQSLDGSTHAPYNSSEALDDVLVILEPDGTVNEVPATTHPTLPGSAEILPGQYWLHAVDYHQGQPAWWLTNSRDDDQGVIPAYYDTGDGTYSADELSNVQDSTEIMLHGDLRSIGCNEYGAAALPLMARLSGTSFPYLLLQK